MSRMKNMLFSTAHTLERFLSTAIRMYKLLLSQAGSQDVSASLHQPGQQQTPSLPSLISCAYEQASSHTSSLKEKTLFTLQVKRYLLGLVPTSSASIFLIHANCIFKFTFTFHIVAYRLLQGTTASNRLLIRHQLPGATASIRLKCFY